VPPVPANFNHLSGPEKTAWLESYWKTPAGAQLKKSAAAGPTAIPVEVAHDGTLRVADIPEGTYELTLSIEVPRIYKAQDLSMIVEPDWAYGSRALAGTYLDHVVVSGTKGEIIPLGDLPLEPVARTEVGAPAPDFALPGLDGGVVKLSAYRGQWVLLNHWAAWCAPAVADIPFLKQLQETYGKDGKLVLLGVAWDEVSVVRTCMEEHNIDWPQALVIDMDSTVALALDEAKAEFKDNYGGGLPQTYLIDPTGKIVAKNLRGEDMVKIVDGFLRAK
jgi:peroxiredoxin